MDAEREWIAVEPDDFEGREPACVLLEHERTSLRYGDATFEFSVDTGERSDSGLIRQIRLSLRETGALVAQGHAGAVGDREPAGDAVPAGAVEAAWPIAFEIVARPRILVASLDKLGPLDLPALRQAVRRLLQTAAAQVAARE